MSILDEAKLCFVKNKFAYFTTLEINKQPADDWDDSPYEHNASLPIDWYERSGRDYYEIYNLSYDGDFEEPCDGPFYGNSPYSVDQINAGVVP